MFEINIEAMPLASMTVRGVMRASSFSGSMDMDASTSQNTGIPPACTTAADCPEGQACVAGLCALADAGTLVCTADDQCPQGMECGEGGICQEPVAGRSNL